MGLLAAGAFAASGTWSGRMMGLLILLSFICYWPVVLWAHKKPALGMLMLPKSVAYAAMLLFSFGF
jgi:hypothetical protein